jgi:hypothetical protein
VWCAPPKIASESRPRASARAVKVGRIMDVCGYDGTAAGMPKDQPMPRMFPTRLSALAYGESGHRAGRAWRWMSSR